MKNKLISVILITLLALLVSVAPVFATTSFNVSLSANNTRVAQGDEVVVTISLKDFTAGETGVNAIALTLDYDKSIFETLEASDLATSQGGWGAPTFNPANGRTAMDASGFVAENHEMLKVTFKVKEDATIGSTTISVKNVEAADGTSEIRPADQSITLTVTKKDVPANNTTTPTNETPKNVNVNAGLEDMGTASVIVPAVVVFALVGIMAYVRYTRIDK